MNTQALGSGETALHYLANYVQRTALSFHRILKEENGRITFKYRQGDTGAWKLLTLGRRRNFYDGSCNTSCPRAFIA